MVERVLAERKRPAIRLRHSRVQHVLGVHLSPDVVADCLRRLNMTLEAASSSPEATLWSVTPPSWRFDIHIEEDLIEEVARLYGFDNIPERDADGDQAILPWTESRVRNERAADLLVDRGYFEAITYTFTDASWQSILFPDAALALSNPISAELGVMRVSLWPGLIQAARENQRRQQLRVRLFEIGRRFTAGTGEETEMVAGLASGSVLPEQWGAETSRVDFFDVKADVEALLALSEAQRISLLGGPASGPSSGTVGPNLAGQPAGGLAGCAPSATPEGTGFDISGLRVRSGSVRDTRGTRAGVPRHFEIPSHPPRCCCDRR